jgi:hypothetical protein
MSTPLEEVTREAIQLLGHADVEATWDAGIRSRGARFKKGESRAFLAGTFGLVLISV